MFEIFAFCSPEPKNVSRETSSLYIAITRRYFFENRRNYDAIRSLQLQELVQASSEAPGFFAAL